MKYFLIAIFLITIYQLPISVSAAECAPFNIWCGTSCAQGGGGPKTPCTFCDGLIVIKNIINSLFTIAIPLAVLMIIYGGFRLMIAGGSEDNVKKGREIIKMAVIGLIIALTAWVIVNTVLHFLTGNPNFPWAQINCS